MEISWVVGVVVMLAAAYFVRKVWRGVKGENTCDCSGDCGSNKCSHCK